MDLAFVLTANKFITNEMLQKQKNFIKMIVDQLTIGPTDTQVRNKV